MKKKKIEIVIGMGMNTISSRDKLLLTEVLLPNLKEVVNIPDRYIVNDGFVLFEEEKNCWDKVLKKEGVTYNDIIKVEYQVGLKCPYHLERGNKLCFAKISKQHEAVDGYSITLTVKINK